MKRFSSCKYKEIHAIFNAWYEKVAIRLRSGIAYCGKDAVGEGHCTKVFFSIEKEGGGGMVRVLSINGL
jgi:hypothetical protein